MKAEKTKSRKLLINLSIAIGVSIVISLLFAGFNSSWQYLLSNLGYGILIGLSLAFGAGAISKKMYKGRQWMENSTKRYIKTMLLITIYIIVDIIIINLLWFHYTQSITYGEIIDSKMFIWTSLIEFFIGTSIFLIILSAKFAKSLTQYYSEMEKNKEALSKYRYATLKNQINPHFLFNSLNVLSGIMYKDTEKADEFISKLANIYRYVLDIQEAEVISLSKEINFAKDYLYLQSIRLGNNLSYSIEVNENKMIIPMALQILIENAIKHNSISDKKELKITISNDNKYVVISNNRNPKQEATIGHEIGIKNIKERYKFLTDREIKIVETPAKFKVYLPLLDLQNN